MDTTLQQLTDKIYQEGVEKGNAEAESILTQARQKAEKIIKEAEDKALKIAQKAKSDSEELQKTALSELQMSAQKVIGALKQEINDLVGGQIIDKEIKAATSDVEFIKKIIETAIKNWSSSDDKALNMNIIVPEKDEKAIISYFAKTSKGVLDRGFTITSANKVKAGFQIAPADGSYKISFTDEDFISFFKAFVRPKVADLLF